MQNFGHIQQMALRSTIVLNDIIKFDDANLLSLSLFSTHIAMLIFSDNK